LEAGEAQPSGWKLLHLKGEALRKVSIKDIHKGLELNSCLQAMTLTLGVLLSANRTVVAKAIGW